MSNFLSAVHKVLAHEGGHVDHPNDPGGETNWGISTRFLRGIGDQRDVEDLSEGDAIALYKEHFWNVLGLDGIGDDTLAEKIFDIAVNMGNGWAGRLLQRALRATGYPVKEDGIVGAKTIQAANAAIPQCLLAALRSEQAGRYRELIAKNPSLGAFANGWNTRAYA